MADGGELSAAFRGLAEDSAQAAESVGRKIATFYDETAQNEDESVTAIQNAEGANLDAINGIRSRINLNESGVLADSGTASGETSRIMRMLNGEGDGTELAQTGGSSFRRPRSELDFETDWADHAYDKIRADPQLGAVSESASTYGFSSEDIDQIYNHLFTEPHELDDGTRLFDANPRIARAWERLQDGDPHPSDIGLLKHELHESSWMRDNGNQNYRLAHQATLDAGYPWDEDGPERDGIPYR